MQKFTMSDITCQAAFAIPDNIAFTISNMAGNTVNTLMDLARQSDCSVGDISETNTAITFYGRLANIYPFAKALHTQGAIEGPVFDELAIAIAQADRRSRPDRSDEICLAP